MADIGGGGVREVKSAGRTVDLLELLAARGDQPARLRELVEELGVPRSSMYALLQTLIDRGWVRTDATGSLYGIGIRALLTGTSYLDSDPRVRVARPYMDEASDALGETIHLARLDGGDVVYLATRESHEYLRPFSRVGRRLPAHVGALGKALLAERDDGELPVAEGPLEQLTPHTHPDRASLVADLAQARVRGYAVDREEGVPGIAGFGFALRYDAPAMDAISCSVPSARLAEGREERIVTVMREIREKIEAAAPRAGAAGPQWR
ncbi:MULTISPECIES: IclR family transcriptional regulator [unclassified Streptomyces]|uniref:IclR family transcriptional regulator n=1 Tax=unclassified Streptomyces TaxID=2593676 RepID=UPI002DDA38B0|nr:MULTISPECIES: IclR family transcriptional regulator [unclassified Streptomyces]WSA92726.1 IclR family transcriptional regulator [Streptomyces sp. NBC_01795]WSB77097.1 IclR family transcriptional regulator [Streptomyces sp. NBC_01775]WSS14636.1 IclR family transcriptional regulator [Streptomyces sp. NBC_01186]WSS43450.1 IclR family transcriptional regulator [Streptomyces sp. NBC_01187]